MISLSTSGESSRKIIGLDPGTSHLGVGIIDFNINDLTIIKSSAFTLVAEKLPSCSTILNQMYGDRFSRISALEQELVRIFDEHMPLSIIAESPFFGLRHPGAFQALTELMCAIRSATIQHDPWKVLRLVPPSVVKKLISLKGGSNKDAMKNSLRILLPELNYCDNYSFEQLDEHSIDALSIGYYGLDCIRKGIFP